MNAKTKNEVLKRCYPIHSGKPIGVVLYKDDEAKHDPPYR